MASLTLSLDELKSNLAMILGVSRTYSAWDATLIADVNRIIRSGRRRFFSANQWQFLDARYTVLTEAPRDTGTVQVASGVVTLTGSTFPTTAATNYLIAFDGNQGVYEIGTYTDTTHVTLKDTSLTLDAGTEYTMYKYRFDMPSNFGGTRGPVTTERNCVIEESAILPDYTLRALTSHETIQTGRPRLFTTYQRVANEDIATPTWFLQIFPLADAVYEIKLDIRLQPGDALDAADSDAIMHPAFAECMAEAIYAQAEVTMQVMQGVHEQRFQALLREAIVRDGKMRGVRRLEPRDSGYRRAGWEISDGTSTWAEE
jgi:hypothetical protein